MLALISAMDFMTSEIKFLNLITILFLLQFVCNNVLLRRIDVRLIDARRIDRATNRSRRIERDELNGDELTEHHRFS